MNGITPLPALKLLTVLYLAGCKEFDSAVCCDLTGKCSSSVSMYLQVLREIGAVEYRNGRKRTSRIIYTLHDDPDINAIIEGAGLSDSAKLERMENVSEPDKHKEAEQTTRTEPAELVHTEAERTEKDMEASESNRLMSVKDEVLRDLIALDNWSKGQGFTIRDAIRFNGMSKTGWKNRLHKLVEYGILRREEDRDGQYTCCRYYIDANERAMIQEILEEIDETDCMNIGLVKAV